MPRCLRQHGLAMEHSANRLSLKETGQRREDAAERGPGTGGEEGRHFSNVTPGTLARAHPCSCGLVLPEAEGHTALPMHASAPLPIITNRDGRFTI